MYRESHFATEKLMEKCFKEFQLTGDAQMQKKKKWFFDRKSFEKVLTPTNWTRQQPEGMKEAEQS